MAVIDVPIGQPYGDISANTDGIYAATADASDPGGATDLLINSAGARSILVLLPIARVARLLADDFVEFTQASGGGGVCYVNRRLWVSITPHPQVPGVVHINFPEHLVAVQGTVATIRERLRPGRRRPSREQEPIG
jgi:hypothetical protein